MYYISIDNDYHFELAVRIIDSNQIDIDNVIFISQINSRNKKILESSYLRIDIEGHPLSSGAGYKNPVVYLKSLVHHRYLKKKIEFIAEDVLLLLTEYQINNALLARQIGVHGGKVYLFDDGIGFYINNAIGISRSVRIIDTAYLLIYNTIYTALGIPAIAKQGFEGRMHVRIKDKYIDRLYSRVRIPLDRKINLFGFAFSNEIRNRLNQLPTVALFLANNLSAFGLKNEEMCLAASAIEQLAKKFDVVYVKIHPADWVGKTETFYFYNQLSVSSKNVKLTSNDSTSNQILKDLNPCIVVGTLGAGMFDALFMGYPAVFLFHLLSRPSKFKVFAEASEGLLVRVGYNFIESLDQIAMSYKTRVNLDKITFRTGLLL
jgi:hypothetical protein